MNKAISKDVVEGNLTLKSEFKILDSEINQNINDIILASINTNTINTNNITFALIRRIGGRDSGIWDQLGRGRNILSTHQQLDQYLYSYGLMIKSQWSNVLSGLKFPSGNIEIIDYACGQGLASIFLMDAFHNDNLKNITKINLIEPSEVAIKRAAGTLECYCPGATIKATCKLLDDLLESDVDKNNNSTKIHLFSNILDIEGFDQFELINKTLCTAGSHWIIAVSHDRDHNGGSVRIRNTYDAIVDKKNSARFSVRESRIVQFVCDNGQPAIGFFINLEN
jgi:hypothetical protein